MDGIAHHPHPSDLDGGLGKSRVKWFLFRLLWVAVGLVCAPAFSARANPPLYAEVICSGTEPAFLVRFAAGEYPDDKAPARPADPPKFAILPTAVDGGLSMNGPTQKTECYLPDGRAVRIRAGEGQLIPLINTESTAFFSLWVDKRKVLSRREWKPGYGQQDFSPWLVAVVYRHGLLIFCSDNQDNKPPVCDSEPVDLANKPVDLAEYPPVGAKAPAVGSVQILPHASRPEVCRMFLNDYPGILEDAPFSLGYDGWLGMFSTHEVDDTVFALGIANLKAGGPRYKFVWRQGSVGGFDGDIVLAAPSSTPTKRLIQFMKNADFQWDKAKLPTGWRLIMGGTPNIYPARPANYIHLADFRLNGRLYFLAWPANTDLTKPTAVIVSLTNDLKIDAACSMQRVDPHF